MGLAQNGVIDVMVTGVGRVPRVGMEPQDVWTFHSLHNSNVFDVIACLLYGAWRYFLHIVPSLLTTRYGFQKFYTMSALEQRGRDAPARLYTISL
jgi:hypothetical protein